MKAEKMGAHKQASGDYKHDSDINIDQYDKNSQDQENVFKTSIDKYGKKRPAQLSMMKEGENILVENSLSIRDKVSKQKTQQLSGHHAAPGQSGSSHDDQLILHASS